MGKVTEQRDMCPFFTPTEASLVFSTFWCSKNSLLMEHDNQIYAFICCCKTSYFSICVLNWNIFRKCNLKYGPLSIMLLISFAFPCSLFCYHFAWVWVRSSGEKIVDIVFDLTNLIRAQQSFSSVTCLSISWIDQITNCTTCNYQSWQQNEILNKIFEQETL